MNGESVVIAGVGPGLGMSLARAFARRRLPGRAAGPRRGRLRGAGGRRTRTGWLPLPADVTQPEAVAAAFDRAERELGPLACAVFNAGRLRAGRHPGDLAGGVRALLAGRRLCRLPGGAGGGAADGAARPPAASCSPAPPPRCAAARGSPTSPARNSHCGRWRRAWRANSARAASMWRMSSSMGRSGRRATRAQAAGRGPDAHAGAGRDRRDRMCSCTASRARPGRTRRMLRPWSERF